jgi:hypothetical protein
VCATSGQLAAVFRSDRGDVWSILINSPFSASRKGEYTIRRFRHALATKETAQHGDRPPCIQRSGGGSRLEVSLQRYRDGVVERQAADSAHGSGVPVALPPKARQSPRLWQELRGFGRVVVGSRRL